MNDILNKKVSFQKNIYSPIHSEVSIIKVLKAIKSDTYLQVTNKLRFLKSTDDKSYKSEKSKLNSVTFCGTFKETRTKANLLTYNSLIILDIDGLDKTEVVRNMQSLQNDPYVLTAWISPSGLGIKGLFSISLPEENKHLDIDKAHYRAFELTSEYLKIAYNIILDSSGSDTTRPCFLSHDPKLYINEHCLSFCFDKSDFIFKAKSKSKKINITIPSKNHNDLLHNAFYRNNSFDRYRIGSIIRYLENRQYSITKSYGDWLRVAFAIANIFTYDIGLKYFIKLSKLDIDKFDIDNCKTTLIKCYYSRKGESDIKTIVYLAQTKGYIF